MNQYTTNNNNYSADFKSWYYDNTTNNYNYTQNNLYYNQDNSRYYISIDNSTDEYYLINVQYSPTFVTVNYTYNTTNNNYDNSVGDVTNIYYYELKDGRNSSTLTAAEVAGMDTGYDVANYELVTDDPNTLSLQHFDGDYTDSSSFNRTSYSQNRSMNYVDSGSFGQAVKLSSGSAAGVTIPNLSSYDSLTFDFRIYYADISNLGIYFGDTNIFQEIPSYRKWTGNDVYSDDNIQHTVTGPYDYYPRSGTITSSQIGYSGPAGSSTTISSRMTVPTSYSSSGYTQYLYSTKRLGWFSTTGAPSLYSSTSKNQWECWDVKAISGTQEQITYRYCHFVNKEYRWTPPQSVYANFSYNSYKNQWVSMRITISGGKLYYFVNGDLVGSGTFTKPTADKFYIKSSGTVYLDELRVTTGSLSSTSTYNPSSAPYDTNKVLALPDKLEANTIYVQHNIKVTNCRIGGVRPSNPEKGFLYIPLHDDRTAAQPQLYDGGNWIDVTAMVHNGDTTVNVLGYKFSPVGDAPDIDMDAKPEHPVKPVDPETCTHNWEKTGGVAATCTAPGTTDYKCSICGTTKSEPALIGELEYVWCFKCSTQVRVKTVLKLPTADTVGMLSYDCSSCGDTKYLNYNGSGHTWQQSTCVDATCAASGAVNYICAVCGSSRTEVIPQISEHTWQETSRTPATCEEDGPIRSTCSVCHATKSEAIPALGHSWTETKRTPATETASGTIYYTCSGCSQTKTESIPPLGGDHVWVEVSRTPAMTAFASYNIADYIDEYSVYIPEPLPEDYGGITAEFMDAHDAWIIGLNTYAEDHEKAKSQPAAEDPETDESTPPAEITAPKLMESAGSNHVVSSNHIDTPADTGAADKYPVGSWIDPAGNVFSASGDLLSPGTTPATAPDSGQMQDASFLSGVVVDSDLSPATADPDTLAVIADLVSDIAADPPVWYVEVLRPADPPAEILTGLKSMVTSIFGEYTPVMTTSVISETVGNDTHQYRLIGRMCG